MGGQSKSSQSSSSTQKTNTITNADYSVGDGDRINTTISGDKNTVTMTDFGAISAAGEVAKDSLAAISQGTQSALNFGKDALNFADLSGQRASDVVKSSLAQVSGLAAANEAGNRDTVKTLSDLAMNLKSDGAAQQTKTVQTVVIGLAIVAGITVAAVSYNRKAA